MQRHHRALAKADQSKTIRCKVVPLKLVIKKRIKCWPRAYNAAPPLGGIAHGERKPLPPHR